MIFLLQEKSSKKIRLKKIRLIPAIKVRPTKWTIPQTPFDYVLVSSPRALMGCRDWPMAKKYVAIGRSTAESIKKCPFPIEVLKNSSSSGILHFFKRKNSARIFFPRSKRANPEIVRQLRSWGHKVCVRHSYQTDLMPLAKYDAVFFNGVSHVFMISSPSCFQALERSFGIARLRKMSFVWVAIGKTSAHYLNQRLKKMPIVAQQPNWQGMLKALLTRRKKISKQ
jgi:uroporphyrinogen-III synthase